MCPTQVPSGVPSDLARCDRAARLSAKRAKLVDESAARESEEELSSCSNNDELLTSSERSNDERDGEASGKGASGSGRVGSGQGSVGSDAQRQYAKSLKVCAHKFKTRRQNTALHCGRIRTDAIALTRVHPH